MEPVDFVIIAVILVILGISGWYIYRSKKSGKKCIGCPDSGTCGSAGCGCGCSGCNKDKE